MSVQRRSKPLAIDLFCGLGGWTEGLLQEGYRVVGFDIERHVYGEHRYPAQLVLQDVLTLHGRQFKDAALIVASPPCQGYSYRAMPWKRAKALPPPDNSLFEACFRIQREACEAAGRYIPLVVENVRGAQKWVGRSRFHFGSFHLWGDVPALMPMRKFGERKTPTGSWDPTRKNYTDDHSWAAEGVKSPGQDWNRFKETGEVSQWNWANEREVKGADGGWFNDAKRKGGTETGRLSQSGSKSPARKAASAMIAKIPIVLSRWVAKAWYPEQAA